MDIKTSHKFERDTLKAAVNRPNTTVRLGPDVVLDFSDLPADWFPIRFRQCVTLTSVASFSPEVVPTAATSIKLISEARTPWTRGPILRFGKHADHPKNFLVIRCNPGQVPNDHVRIAGFRIYGPAFGAQSTDEYGIHITRCVDIEITNMEIAGWGGAAIRVDDEPAPTHDSGRIFNPGQIRIHRNFIHHNQHPTKDGHAVGYGVNVQIGAWAEISENVFDFNRHAIAASGDAGGYAAERNLILKGGGYHGSLFAPYTHILDVHGTDNCWPPGDHDCGQAGYRFWYDRNSFQYRNDNAIKIRGTSRFGITISNNIFPHAGLEDDWGDDAINLHTKKNVVLGPGNVIKVDSFGQYGVCDFDGDAIDDLFLPTGKTWWYSSAGEFHWSYLNEQLERLNQVRLGYFDDDPKCDVLADRDGRWMISSGGQNDWQLMGDFGTTLTDIEFGRFDPNMQDSRPGATRRTTHAFKRASDGGWFVTPLSAVAWEHVRSSSLSMKQLRFGDFTGDGVTDVLAVVSGRWAISESAHSPWRRLNPDLGTAVNELFIANLDPDDNIDDILRLERKTQRFFNISLIYERTKLIWWRSKNGTDSWRQYKTYAFEFPITRATVFPRFGFAGRFGGASGGGVLVIDQDRRGQFFSEAEKAVGASADWKSQFAY